MAKQKAQATAPRMPVSCMLANQGASCTDAQKQDTRGQQTLPGFGLRVDDLVVEIMRQRVGHGQKQTVGGRHGCRHTAGSDQTGNHVGQTGHFRRCQDDDVRVEEELVDLE